MFKIYETCKLRRPEKFHLQIYFERKFSIITSNLIGSYIFSQRRTKVYHEFLPNISTLLKNNVVSNVAELHFQYDRATQHYKRVGRYVFKERTPIHGLAEVAIINGL